jgi:hypothetical protein
MGLEQRSRERNPPTFAWDVAVVQAEGVEHAFLPRLSGLGSSL